MPLRCRARFAFIEFSSETEAAAAIQKANGYKLDKAHTFVVNSFEDHAKYMAVPDEETDEADEGMDVIPIGDDDFD